MKFKKLRKVILQTECISINTNADNEYVHEAYLNIDRVPNDYDNYEVINISSVSGIAVPKALDVVFDGIGITLKKK